MYGTDDLLICESLVLYYGSMRYRAFYVDRKGYKRYKDNGRPVHQEVAEGMLGRSLKSGEVVHHKNRDKLDNRRSNLAVLQNQRVHNRLHFRRLRKFGKW